MVLLDRCEVPISPQNYIPNFNVVFIYKLEHTGMCVFPASHLKVHATIEKGTCR
jgi:hypothetical protein